MNRQRLAWLCVTIGAGTTVVGAGLIYIPAALLLLGSFLAALGLFGLDVDKPRRRGERK